MKFLLLGVVMVVGSAVVSLNAEQSSLQQQTVQSGRIIYNGVEIKTCDQSAVVELTPTDIRVNGVSIRHLEPFVPHKAANPRPITLLMSRVSAQESLDAVAGMTIPERLERMRQAYAADTALVSIVKIEGDVLVVRPRGFQFDMRLRATGGSGETTSSAKALEEEFKRIVNGLQNDRLILMSDRVSKLVSVPAYKQSQVDSLLSRFKTGGYIRPELVPQSLRSLLIFADDFRTGR